MNGVNYQSATKDAVRPKFRGHRRKASRRVPRYPDTAEREYRRVNRAYMRIFRDALRERLPEIMEAYEKEMRGDSREDGISDFLAKVHEVVNGMAAELEKALEAFNLGKAVERVSEIERRYAILEWEKTVKSTLGVDLLDDYYKGEKYDQLIDQWVSENLSQIESIPSETLQELEQIITDAYRQGKPLDEVADEIQKAYKTSRSRAEFLARDQLALLNARITKMQHQDAGVSQYKWHSSHDSRVRECHREFDGHIYRWDDPPEAWYSTKSRGVVHTGRRCNPGEDYGCRCIAIPVFDVETINLPLRGEANEQKAT